MKFPKIPRRFLPLLLLFIILVVTMPRTAKFNYDYKKGSPWPYETLISQFDFPILKTQDQIQEERESAGTAIIPYYRYSEEATNNCVKAVENLDLGNYNNLKPTILSSVTEIFAKGVVPDGKIKLDRGAAAVSKDVLFIQRNKRVQKYPVSEVYKVSDAQNKLLADLAKGYPKVNLDSLLSKGGVYEVVVPNLVYDKAATELVHAESADFISPTLGYVNVDQRIVSKGEIITAEIAQILDSYKAEYNKTYGYGGPRILLWAGNMLLALALVVILYFCILYTNPEIFKDRNRYLYLLLVFLLSALAAFSVEKFRPEAVYMVPFSVCALYLMAFFRDRVVLPVYIVSLLPLLIFSGNGTELFVMYLVAGVVAMFAFRYLGKGWKQFITALIVFSVLTVTYFGFRLVDAGSSPILKTVLQLFLGSMLTVALYPLIYLFEKIFNLLSITRLEELSDTGNPLLRELSRKAPGTFQHCLQVMGMADAAARSIGANVPLVRAGALYHDIGKMDNPLCFIENENSAPGSVHYHDALTPAESARAIIAHVDDGMRIAAEKGLPDVISDFIITHHGTGCTGYFYSKFLSEGGDPADAADFHYNGRKPSTKEQVILMLCDSLEAASRTLKENTAEAYDAFVEKIVGGKVNDGQIDDADISLHELNTIKTVLKQYLRQMYHERIEYPAR